jgi:hypothetical protein
MNAVGVLRAKAAVTTSAAAKNEVLLEIETSACSAE